MQTLVQGRRLKALLHCHIFPLPSQDSPPTKPPPNRRGRTSDRVVKEDEDDEEEEEEDEDEEEPEPEPHVKEPEEKEIKEREIKKELKKEKKEEGRDSKDKKEPKEKKESKPVEYRSEESFTERVIKEKTIFKNHLLLTLWKV